MTPDVFTSGDKASQPTPPASEEKIMQDQRLKSPNSRIEEESFEESFEFEE